MCTCYAALTRKLHTFKSVLHVSNPVLTSQPTVCKLSLDIYIYKPDFRYSLMGTDVLFGAYHLCPLTLN